MLPARHRLTRAADFREVVRRGRRAGGPLLVLHVSPGTAADPIIGFVVSRAVGPAVTRNLAKRRLRHLLRDRISALAPGSRVVVRAQRGIADASYSELGEEIDRLLARVGQGTRP